MPSRKKNEYFNQISQIPKKNIKNESWPVFYDTLLSWKQRTLTKVMWWLRPIANESSANITYF